MWIRNILASEKPERSRARARPVIETLDARRMLSAVSLVVSGTTVVEGNDGVRSAAVVVSLSKPRQVRHGRLQHRRRDGRRRQRLLRRFRQADLRPRRNQQDDPGPREGRPTGRA